MMTFGKKIALLRKVLGLSQTELAKSLNTVLHNLIKTVKLKNIAAI
ncbi:hypothetical protein SAMN05444407_105395 [Chryseobacterium contaminans]|uniref:Uncharacterized protein n=1 Tax=Chryseobacterium contaminans TaxID=1423959 RepID=A0A1M7CW07_9FLAO|nr:hypothetical protein SAMN05444407_105395 [Chryseobacterium contaminans]